MTLTIKTETVIYKSPRRTYEGYLARPNPPQEQDILPMVVLAHDWSGLNAGIRNIADRVAGLGYICFALDVYGQGIRGDEHGDNRHLMEPLLADREELKSRLLDGVAYGLDLPGVDPKRWAAVGYCFGGLCALDLARSSPVGLRASVSVHGAFSPPPNATRQPITTSILLLHGWDDPVAPPDSVLSIARELSEAGADWQLHAYGHAQHAFTFEGANAPESGVVYYPRAAARAWAALATFLKESLD